MDSSKVEQRVELVKGADYYNFFFTPGSMNSLDDLVSKDWRVVFIKDTGESACVLLERKL